MYGPYPYVREEGRKELSAGKEKERSSAAPYRRLDLPRFKVDDDDEDGALNRRHQRSPAATTRQAALLPLHYGRERGGSL